MPITPFQLQQMEARLASRKGPKGLPRTKGGGGVEYEADLHDQIARECLRRGWLAFHGRMDTRSGRTLGEPDFVILTENRSVLLVECKARNRKRSTEQRSVEVWARKLKHIVWLVFAFDDFMAICEMTAHWRDPKHDYSLPAAQREAGK